jgi:hypothetical protein
VTAIAADGARPRAERIALLVWLLLALGIVGRLVFERCVHGAEGLARQNVYLKVFVPAADAFEARRDLYTDTSGFRYPPVCAWAFGLFAACGPLLGSILWRLVNMAVLLAGVRACARAALPVATTGSERAFVLALVAVTGIGSLNIGQSNALLLGCVLLAAAGALTGRRALPAGAVATATAVKVYPFAFGMVLTVLRPRSWWTFVLGLAVVALLPYALAPADYVSAQYAALADGLAHEDRTHDPSDAYRDLRLVVAAFGGTLPPSAWLPLQGLGGLAVAAGAFVLRRRDELAALVFAVSGTLLWMLLLGPSTEKLTYQLLGVPLAWQAILAWRARARGRMALLATALLLVVADMIVSPKRDVQAEQPWLRCFSPFAAILVAIDLAVSVWAGSVWRRAPARDIARERQ